MSVLDYETEWCKTQLETVRRERNEVSCNCWVVCTEECEKEKAECLTEQNAVITQID